MFTTSTMVLAGLVFLPFFLVTLISLVIFRRKARERRSPLTVKLLRGPGEGLRTGIEKLSEQIDSAYFNLLMISLPPLILLWVFSYLGGNKVQFWQLALVCILYVSLIVWAIKNFLQLLEQRRNLYLGLDCELAVGQELNFLMRDGYYVYHDFPAESFNIDHVAVGPHGIFAIETKGRGKPDKGRGSHDATVIFEDNVLKFPDWEDRKFIEQARRQASWLKSWVSKAIGEDVEVQAVLALPGWYIERKAKSDVIIYNGKSPQAWVRAQRKGRLNDNQIKRINHQLEQRCRDVEPTAYRKRKSYLGARAD